MNKNGCYIDLHAHLDGSVTVDIAKKLAALQNIALPADNDEELLTLLSVPDSCESLNDFLQCFDLPGRLMQTPEGLQNAVTLVLENMAQDGVIYAELRFAPQFHTLGGMTQEQVERLFRASDHTSSGRGSGIGVKNVNERIKLYFGTGYGLEILSEPDEGTTVTAHLPAIPYQEVKKEEAYVK